MYSNTFNGYVMPSRIWAGVSSSVTLWCGTDVLAPLIGVKVGATGSTQEAAQRVAKMLDCPANDRPKDAPNGICPDYTYNSHLGDDRAIRGSPQFNAGMESWAFFKKRTYVPANVIVALDVSHMLSPNDERFANLGDLITQNGGSRLFPRGGSVHRNKANILFHDGSVRHVKAFHPIDGNWVPTTANLANTELAEWMIRHKAATDSVTTIEQHRWKKGRPLPF
jgi:prepilin-type processing-associated H-X9-DG protein